MALDSGSTAFMLVSTALVQLMTPGVAFFYGGLVTSRNVVALMMQTFVAMGLITVLWIVVGFSLCFGKDRLVFGEPWTYAFLSNVSASNELVMNGTPVAGIPGMVFVFYQLTFAIITPTLMTGAFADRLSFKPYLIFITIWFFVVYCPFCHLVWGGGLYATSGVWDFAGGTVVHMTSGWSALGSLVVLGKRPRRRQGDRPHNLPFVALGTAILWFGWFGFNGGSSLGANSAASVAYLNTQIAAATSLFCWVMLDWTIKGKPQLVGACIGAVSGLVVVTPCAGYVQPTAALVLGIVAASVCYGAIELRQKALSKYLDDALDVWGCHGVGGLAGAILVGALADPQECSRLTNGDVDPPTWCVNPNTATRSWEQLGKQLVAAVICAGYCTVITPVILKVMSWFIKLVPLLPEDAKGLDEHEHGELAYDSDAETQTQTDMVSSITF